MKHYRLLVYLFFIVVLLIGFIFLESLEKSKKIPIVIEMTNEKSEKMLFSFPKLLSPVVDPAQILTSKEKKEVLILLREIQKNTPEKIKFIIYNRVLPHDSAEVFDVNCIKALITAWYLKGNHVVLLSLFHVNSNGETMFKSSTLIKGKKTLSYFAKDSMDAIVFELKRGLEQEKYRKDVFIRITAALLDRVQYSKGSPLKEDHISMKYLSRFYESKEERTFFVLVKSLLSGEFLTTTENPILSFIIFLIVFCFIVFILFFWILLRFLEENSSCGPSPYKSFKDLPPDEAFREIERSTRNALKKSD